MSLSCICYENRPSGIYGIRSLQRYSTNFLCYQLNLYCGVRRIQQVGGGQLRSTTTVKVGLLTFRLQHTDFALGWAIVYHLPPTVSFRGLDGNQQPIIGHYQQRSVVRHLAMPQIPSFTVGARSALLGFGHNQQQSVVRNPAIAQISSSAVGPTKIAVTISITISKSNSTNIYNHCGDWVNTKEKNWSTLLLLLPIL